MVYDLFLLKIEYVKGKVVFLLDNSDTLAAYEDKGKDNSVSSQEAGFQAMFNQLDRVQQVEMIQRKQNVFPTLLIIVHYRL